MKKAVFSAIRTVVFIIFLIIAFVFAVPVHNRLEHIADSSIERLTNSLSSLTGLSISYKSLSPSVLSNFIVNDIQLYDKDSEQIIHIDRAKISYSILNIIKGNFQKGINNITIDGVEIQLDDILNIIQQFTTENKNSNFNIQSLRTKIPENIRLKNVSVEYENKTAKASLLLKDATINNNLKKSYLGFQLESSVKGRVSQYKKNLSCGLSLNGVLHDKIDDSYAQIKLANVTDGDYKLNKLHLMVTYMQNEFELQTIQVSNPIAVNAIFNFKTGNIMANIEADKLAPVSVININSDRQLRNKLRGLYFSTDTTCNGNIKNKSIDFVSKTGVYVPASIFPEGVNVDFSVYGNEKELNISTLNASGPRCNADMNLSVVYKSLQLSGILELPNFTLPNGNTLSTEVYFDPLKKGFMMFSPQTFIGDKSITALQLSIVPENDVLDFALQLSDYSHAMEDEPGDINVDGSFVIKEKFLESRFAFNNIYLDSVMEFGAELLNEKMAQTLNNNKKKVETYLAAGDVDVRCYLGAKENSISYDVHYLMIANTKNETQAMLITLNGNEQTLQLDQLSLVYGKQSLQANASLFRDLDSSDLYYDLTLFLNSVPYHVSGTVMPEMISATGDYNINLQLVKNKKNYTGRMECEYLPVVIDKYSLILSTLSDFSYDTENGIVFNLARFEMEFDDTNVSVNPKIVFTGNVTKYGAQFTSVSYSDLYATLDGIADVAVNVNGGVFNSAILNLNLKNPLSEESIIVDGSVTNTDFGQFSFSHMKESLYFNGQVQVNRFGLNRFSTLKNEDNYVTASIFASGTLEHPYVALSVDKFSMLFASDFLKANGSAVLDDGFVKINDFNMNYSSIDINDISSEFSLETMEGYLNGKLNAVVSKETVEVPFSFVINNTLRVPGKLIPDSFMATLSAEKVTGSFIKKPFDLSMAIAYSDGEINFFSSDNIGLYGSYSKNGNLSAVLNCSGNISADIKGIVNNTKTEINIDNISAEVQNLLSYVNFDRYFIVNKGHARGDVSIKKSLNDPEFTGSLVVTTAEAILPIIVPYKITVPLVNISIFNNQIDINEAVYTVKGAKKTRMGYSIFLNKWSLDRIEGYVKTDGKEKVPAKMNMGYLLAAGDVGVDIKLKLENGIFEVTGDVKGDKVKLASSVATVTGVTKSKKKLYKRFDMNVLLENHASFDFDPLLRCVLAPNSKIHVNVDQEDSYYSIDGLVKIKSGDISYLNRNFYIKSGSLRFVPDRLMNPKITINAETRERDSSNQNVRIIFDVDNQDLLDFEPKFTSIPAKSENEIRQMLGEIVIADVNSSETFGGGVRNIAGTAGDYAIQSVIGRKIENKLREGLNFDIFSVRTNVIQNIMSETSMNNELSNYSNLFDNSTVYIGKYIGDSLYFDSMLQVTLDDLSNGLYTFKPELGLELELPTFDFLGTKSTGAVRGAVSGDYNKSNLESKTNLFVPSISFSWKVSF